MEESPKRKVPAYITPVLGALMEDPTMPPGQMAGALGISRQTLWKEKRRLERDNRIWGYTTAMDLTSLGWVMGVVLFRTRHLCREFARRGISFFRNRSLAQNGALELDTFITNGEYDMINVFAAPDIVAARRYYEQQRVVFDDHIMGKPHFMEVAFPIYIRGKPNPRVEDFTRFVPRYTTGGDVFGVMGAEGGSGGRTGTGCGCGGKTGGDSGDGEKICCGAGMGARHPGRPLSRATAQIIQALLEDPTMSGAGMAKKLGITRQKLWKVRRMMEEEGAIWGYTAVCDPVSPGGITATILYQSKSLDMSQARMAVDRVREGRHRREGVMVHNVFYLNGKYDIMSMISAPDLASARAYYESVREAFRDIQLTKPIMMEVAFPFIIGGKFNPGPERIYGLIP